MPARQGPQPVGREERLLIDELGEGDLNYDSRIHQGDEDWQQFQADFPEIHLGDVVTVGRIIGTMQGR